MMQVAAHRLVVCKPRLGDDVLAVVRLELLNRGLNGLPIGRERSHAAHSECCAPSLDLGCLLDQGTRVVLLL